MMQFLSGMMVGGIIGVPAMCLCTAASRADRRMNLTDPDE